MTALPFRKMHGLGNDFVVIDLRDRPVALTLPQRLFAEALGTGLLVATVVGSGIMAARLAAGNDALALLCNAIATGAILVVLDAGDGHFVAHFASEPFDGISQFGLRLGAGDLPSEFGHAILETLTILERIGAKPKQRIQRHTFEIIGDDVRHSD